MPRSSEFPARSALHKYTGAPSCVPRPGPALTPIHAPIPGTAELVTARRRIHWPTLAAPYVGVAPFRALRLRGIARRARTRLRRSACGGGYPTLRELAEILYKRPYLPAQPCQLATISQKITSTSPPRSARTADQPGHSPLWTPTRPDPAGDLSPFVTDFGILSQMKAGRRAL